MLPQIHRKKYKISLKYLYKPFAFIDQCIFWGIETKKKNTKTLNYKKCMTHYHNAKGRKCRASYVFTKNYEDKYFGEFTMPKLYTTRLGMSKLGPFWFKVHLREFAYMLAFRMDRQLLTFLAIRNFVPLSLRASHDNLCGCVQVWNRVKFLWVLWGPEVQLGKQCWTACAVSLGRKPRWHQQGSSDTHIHTLRVRTNAECELNVLESTRRVEAPAHPSGGVSILPRPNTSLLILTQIVERILMGLLCVHGKNSGIV